jgi:uncharacterized protein
VALRLGREWGVGRAGEPGDPARNTGLIMLVVPKETSPDGRGHLRIETGLGTNTFITAAEGGRIADLHVIPAFREGDYGTGILHGVQGLAQEYAERFGFELTGEIAEAVQERRGGDGAPGLPGILIAIIVVAILIALFSGRGGGGGRGGRRRSNLPIILPLLFGGRGGFGGGGFGGGGFGGGGFGGGGFGGVGGGGGFGGGGIGRSW